MRRIGKLTTRRVETVTRPGKYGDGLGLWLYVRPSGTKSWVFRYMRHNKAREMGLGPLHTLSLADARSRAYEARRQLLDGIDPIEANQDHQRKLRVAEASALTFKECSKRFIETHKVGWKNDKHIKQWTSTLKTYVYPVFGELPVRVIDTGLVLKVLEPIWTEKTETATRLRGRIERILDWAKARDYREGENPALWRGHLDNLLPPPSKVRSVKHFSALPYTELPAFMKILRGCEGTAAQALEFAILTAARSGEVRGADWGEIDLAAKVWTIPPERMKAGKAHRVPISDRTLAILEEMHKQSTEGFVFPGNKPRKPLSDMSLSAVLRRMKRDDLTVHGFRSTFRDWTAEQTAYPRDVAEQALAHTIGDKVEAAYRRGDLIEKRKRLMGDWAVYCQRVPVKGAVVAIRETVK